MAVNIADPRTIVAVMDFGSGWQALNALLRQAKLLEDLRGTDAESTDLRIEVRKTDDAIAALRDALDIPA